MAPENDERRGSQAEAAEADPAAATTPADELSALRQDLDEANRKGQEYLGLLQRAQADFVNYRRRVEQERGESLKAGKGELALRILPVLDDFDRALKNRPDDLAQNQWVQGIELIGRKLLSALEAEGVVRIQPLGKDFDPWEHEAVLHAPSAPDMAGKVVDVYREGYKLGNKVLRPAQVMVGRGPE